MAESLKIRKPHSGVRKPLHELSAVEGVYGDSKVKCRSTGTERYNGEGEGYSKEKGV